MGKKVVIFALTLLFFTGIIGSFWGFPLAQAASSIWNSCPKGKVNCAYPGDCKSYIDTNNDRICDYSQPAPPATSTTKTTTPTGNTGTSDKEMTTGSAPLTSTASSDSPSASGSQVTVDARMPVTTENDTANRRGSSYYFLPVIISLVILYCLTWLLSAKKLIKTITHRKIWNVVLLVSLLGSALPGIILILNIDFDTNITLPFNMLFWHVEAGLVLGVVAVFHIAWHRRYFAKILAINRTGKEPLDTVTHRDDIAGQRKVSLSTKSGKDTA